MITKSAIILDKTGQFGQNWTNRTDMENSNKVVQFGQNWIIWTRWEKMGEDVWTMGLHLNEF